MRFIRFSLKKTLSVIFQFYFSNSWIKSSFIFCFSCFTKWQQLTRATATTTTKLNEIFLFEMKIERQYKFNSIDSCYTLHSGVCKLALATTGLIRFDAQAQCYIWIEKIKRCIRMIFVFFFFFIEAKPQQRLLTFDLSEAAVGIIC